MPESERLIAGRMQQLREKGQADFDVRHFRKDGSVLPLHVNVKVVDWGGRQVLMSIATDLSERMQAEDQIGRVAALLDAVQAMSRVGGWEYDVASGRMTWTDEVYRIYGVKKEYDPGNISSDIGFYAPGDDQVIKKAFQAAVEQGEPYDLELAFVNAAGRHLFVHTRGRPVIADGKVVRVTGMIMDVTDRKRAESEILQQEEVTRAILNATTDSVSLIDHDGVILRLNEVTAKRFGMSADELVGKVVFDLFPPEIGERRRGKCDEVFHTGKTVRYEDVRQGHVFDNNLYPVFDTSGNVIAIATYAKEITEQKKAEAALRESEERFRIGATSVSDAIWDWDLPLHTLQWFGNIDDLLGYPPGTFPRTIEAWEEAIHPDDRPRVLDVLGRHLETRTPYSEEYRVIRRDGEVRTWTDRGMAMWDEAGTAYRMIGACNDITERKRAVEALQMANRKLNLLGSVTRHDILNQLLVVNGYLSLLAEKVKDPAFETMCSRIMRATAQIEAMIRFTKEYEQVGVCAPAWQDVRTVVDIAATGAPHGPVRVQNDLPAGTAVFADPLIAKVFYNLMDNAMRHGGTVTMIRFSSGHRNGDLVISCEDDGVGVPPEEKGHIFERGYGKNTGLGLFLASEILSITGITIAETGEEGKGARFEITVAKGGYR